jgi:hypothetical protein
LKRAHLVALSFVVATVPFAGRVANAHEAVPTAPPGFHVETDTRVERIGKWVFVGSYAIAAMVPTLLLLGEAFTGGNVNNPPIGSVLPNYIPLAGPFITLSTSGVYTDSGSVFYTRLSIPGQVLGAGLWIYGYATRGTRLVPDGPTAAVTYAPIGLGGLAILGRF